MTSAILMEKESVKVVVGEGGAGIGKADVSRPDTHWPLQYTLRFHLRGLESLTLTWVTKENEKMEHEISILSHSGFPIIQATKKKEEIGEVVECIHAPFAVSFLQEDGEECLCEIPLPVGARIEVKFPDWTLLQNPEKVNVQWIDFYR